MPNLEAAINTVVALLLNLSLPVLSPFATCAFGFAALCPGAAQRLGDRLDKQKSLGWAWLNQWLGRLSRSR